MCVRFGSRRALLYAKRNVDLHYSVVGLVERMGASLKVMEAMLPAVFGRGVGGLYDRLRRVESEFTTAKKVRSKSGQTPNVCRRETARKRPKKLFSLTVLLV